MPSFSFGLKDGGWRLLYRRKYTIGLVLTLLVFLRSIFYHVPAIQFTLRQNTKRVPFVYKDVVINPTVDHGTNLFALILVSSSPHSEAHRQKRDAIRKTWGNCANLLTMYRESRHLPKDIACKLVFFIARSDHDEAIRKEANENNDVLLVDYTDRYSAITLKLMVAFKWASSLNPSFILKTDDDVYIHTPKLFGGLVRETDGDFYGGIVLEGSKVQREVGHRHYISREQYKDDYYPPYCKGAMYVFSGNLLPRILYAADYVPYMHVDDAYVGLLMYYIGVEVENLHFFVHFKTVFLAFPYTLTDCAINRIIAISDSFQADMIYSIHERIKASENMLLTRYLCYTDSRATIIVVCLIIIIMVTVYNVLKNARIIGFHYKQ